MTAVLAIMLAGTALLSDTTNVIPSLDCPGGHIITQAEIEASGAVYYADVLQNFEQLRMATVDGYAWLPAQAGGIPSGGTGFTLLVDGVPVPAGFFGEVDIDQLPVPIMEIETITLCPAPGVTAGRFRDHGTIHIVTVGASSGLSTLGTFQVGNETGDPGPYFFTDRATPNVARSGFDVEGALGYEGTGTTIRVEGRSLQFPLTDPAIRPRIDRVTTRQPVGRSVWAGGLRGRLPAIGLDVSASGQYVSDLQFFEPVGQELPIRQVGGGLNVRGEWPAGRWLGREIHVGYRLGAHTQLIDEQESGLDGFDPDWQKTHWTTSIEARADADTRTLAAGASVERVRATGPGLDEDAGFTLATIFIQRIQRPRSGIGQRTDLAVVTTGGRAGLKLAQTLVGTVSRHAFTLGASLAGQPPEEQPGFGYWFGQGYTGLNRPNSAYRPLGPPGVSRSGSAWFGWHYTLAAGLSTETHVEVRALRGLYIERPAFQLIDEDVAVRGTITAVPDARGETVAARASVVGAGGPWHARAFYSLLTDVGGTDAFRDAWQRVPIHRGGVAVTLRPDSNFSVRASLTAQSGTTWPGYLAIDGVAAPNGYVYSDTVPALWLLNASVSKHFWNRRLRAILSFRNILDVEERYHPIGAMLNFRLFARIEARLGG